MAPFSGFHFHSSLSIAQTDASGFIPAHFVATWLTVFGRCRWSEVRGRRSRVAGRAPLPLNKTELAVFIFALLQSEYLWPEGLSQRRNVYLLHIFATAAAPPASPSICSIQPTTTFCGVAKVAQILILIKLINMVKSEPETDPRKNKRQNDPTK